MAFHGETAARGAPVDALAARKTGLFYGWILLAVFWVVLVADLAFPMYGGAVLNTALARDLGFSREQMGLPFSVFFGVVGLASPLVAAIIGRIGVRWTLLIGNLATALGALAMATMVHSNIGSVLFFGVVIGFGVASGGNLTAQTAIPRWFVRRRSLAYAIMLTASAMGGIIAAPTMNWVLSFTHGNWRAGWWLMAAVSIAAALLSAALVREYPADIGQSPDGDAASLVAADTRPHARPVPGILMAAIRSADFWAIVFASAVITGEISLILAHGIANALDAGFTQTEAAWSMALVSSSGVGGKVIAGAVGDRFNPAWIWGALLVPMGLGLILATTGTSSITLYAFAILAGGGFGAAIVCQPATIAARFGAANFARVAGIIFMLQAIAGIIVPVLAGWAFSKAAGYSWSFFGVGLACFAAAAFLAVSCRATPPRERFPA